MVVVWSRQKAREAAEAGGQRSALVSVWRGALGWAWWFAPLCFCAAVTIFGVVWLLKWPTLGADPAAPAIAAIAVFVLLLSLPAFGLFTAMAAVLPRPLRGVALVMLIAALLMFAR
jgi:hypothetical protein